MRVLVLSDIHSNLEALHAVVGHATKEGGFDGVWVTGDLVGYGPDPGPVLDALRVLGATCVGGNHDLAACGRIGVDAFNPVAAEAALWTAGALNERDRDGLRELPLTCIEEGVTLVHGSLREPEWEYLLDHEPAEAQFSLQTTPVSIVGHSHLQFVCIERDGDRPRFHYTSDGDDLLLDDHRVILNAGSVGQPRDGDPRAGYMLLDTTARVVGWRRVPYDIDKVRAKIDAAGLPRVLGARLYEGR